MFYSMTISFLLAILISIAHVHSIPVSTGIADSCDVDFSSSGSCTGTISISRECQTAKLNLATTDISTCTSVGLFWSYPTNNLTLTIGTPFTKKQQAYQIEIDNKQFRGNIFHVYRIVNGQEIEVTTTDEKLVLNSDADFQIVLKLQGLPTTLSYGVFINYKVVKM
ncbi:hypothetical protein I4U23_005634 [Adineta vaga]|nr:hypothetical protein I4U23_005634 [Adineta vaga]